MTRKREMSGRKKKDNRKHANKAEKCILLNKMKTFTCADSATAWMPGAAVLLICERTLVSMDISLLLSTCPFLEILTCSSELSELLSETFFA